MQEFRDESEIYNYQGIQLSNNKYIKGMLGGTLDLAWLRSEILFLEFWVDIVWRCSATLFTDARAIFRPTCASHDSKN